MSSGEPARELGFGAQLCLLLVFVTLNKSLKLSELQGLHA